MIVDGEAVVRETAASILEAEGLTVLAASDGESALQVARNPGAIDLVLLDLTIPGCAVEQTHRTLRELLPAAGILLISGFTEPSVLSKLCADPRTRFLQKPFSAAALSTLVRSLLS